MNNKNETKKNPKKPSRFLPILLTGVGLILLMVILITRPARGSETEKSFVFSFPPIELNQPAPELTLLDLDGNEISLNDFSGEVILVNNWATWCPPCRNSIPAFIRLYNKYHEQGFVMLGIGLDDEQALRDYSKQMQIPYPILIGNKEIAKTYQVSGIPKTIFIDKKGNIRKSQTGFAPELEAQFDALVESMLTE